MYTREIQAPTDSPIKDGIPFVGTWNKAFDKVDLLDIRKPYPYPVPRWIVNYRIKEWHCLNAQDDNFLLEAFFYNVKFYRIAQILVYDKKNDEKHLFRKIIPGMGWTLPESLANSSIDCHSSGFYFRIHNWLEADVIRFDANITAFRRRPSLTVHLAYDVSPQIVTPMAVSLKRAERRIMYAYKTLAPVHGNVDLGGRQFTLKQETCSGIFCDYKGFFPLRLQTAVCSATSIHENNHRFGFHIAENQAKEPNKNNENVLWIDGQFTPLPPVLITMPSGPEDMWVIQDVEGMIDLTFTPIKQIKTGTSLLGYYNGILLTAEGEQIQIKNLFGIGEKFNLQL